MDGASDGSKIGTRPQHADLILMFRRYHESIAQHKVLVAGARLTRWANAEKEREHDKDVLDREYRAADARIKKNPLREERSALWLKTLDKNAPAAIVAEFKAKDAALKDVYKAEGYDQLRARLLNLDQRRDQDWRDECQEILDTVFPGTSLATWAPFCEPVAGFGGRVRYDPDDLEERASSALGFSESLLKSAAVYLGAYELFEENKEGFLRAYPRALAYNPITNAISWVKVQKRITNALSDAFPQRYESKVLPWEALVIGILLSEQVRPAANSLEGVEYEAECAKVLSNAGYTVESTPVSGDFGVDLLARKNGLTYAIQCKCHGMPVGVGAVQEVAAGLVHYVADCAVVVALSGFTNAARRLAESTSVLLIGAGQLSSLEDLALPLI